MGIENITEKILAEAHNDARRIFDKGRYDSRDTIYRMERLLKQKKSDMEAKALSDAETVKKRKHSVAELEARKMRLGAKQEAISQCFEEAMIQLTALPEEKYIDLLARTIDKMEPEGGEILLNSRDRERIGEKLLAAVNGRDNRAKLCLAEDTISAAGGFVLRKGAVEINSTLEVMVAAIREEVTLQVVETLFGQG